MPLIRCFDSTFHLSPTSGPSVCHSGWVSVGGCRPLFEPAFAQFELAPRRPSSSRSGTCDERNHVNTINGVSILVAPTRVGDLDFLSFVRVSFCRRTRYPRRFVHPVSSLDGLKPVGNGNRNQHGNIMTILVFIRHC